METFYLEFLDIMELMNLLFTLRNFLMGVLKLEIINSILLFQPNLTCHQVSIIKVLIVLIMKNIKRTEIRKMWLYDYIENRFSRRG